MTKLQETKLQKQIIAWLEPRCVMGDSHCDSEIARDLEVMPASVSNAMAGLIKAKRVERTAPRHYRLRKPDESGGPRGVPGMTKHRMELAKALGYDETCEPPDWSALLAEAHTADQCAAQARRALALTDDASVETILGRIERLTAAEQFVSLLCETLDVLDTAPWEPARSRVLELLEAKQQRDEYRRGIKEVAESRAAVETQLGRMRQGVKALRAMLDTIAEED